MSGQTLLVRSWEKLLKSGAFSDFIISCQGKEFKVHRALIAADSTFFSSICTSSFKEAKDGRVDLVDEKPEIVARMLSFMYTGDYNDFKVPEWAAMAREMNNQAPEEVPGSGVTDPNHKVSCSEEDQEKDRSLSSMEINTLVYACGDKFDIPSLKSAAAAKFANSLPQDTIPARFQEAAELVFLSTAPGDSELRYLLLDWALDHHQDVSTSLAEIIARHEPLSWKMHLKSISMLDLQSRDIQARADRQEQDMRTNFEIAIEAVNDQHEKLSGNIRSFVQKYRKAHSCSSCNFQYGGLSIQYDKSRYTNRVRDLYFTCSQASCGKRR